MIPFPVYIYMFRIIISCWRKNSNMGTIDASYCARKFKSSVKSEIKEINIIFMYLYCGMSLLCSQFTHFCKSRRKFDPLAHDFWSCYYIYYFMNTTGNCWLTNIHINIFPNIHLIRTAREKSQCYHNL